MAENKNKKYPSVRKFSNWYGEEFPLNKEVVVQEKLDGSNVTIELTSKAGNTSYELFSRTKKLDLDDEYVKKSWGVLFAWADENLDLETIGKYMEDRMIPTLRLHGEWLMMQKLSYNKTHKNSFWLFDVVTNKNGGDEFEFEPANDLEELAKVFGLNHVPIVAKGLTLSDVFKDVASFVDEQKTLVPSSDSLREGVVVKLVDGSMRMKFVSDKFKEGMGQRKDKKAPLFQINTTQLVTDNMIQKYIFRMMEEGILDKYVDYADGPTKGTIFKNSARLVDDFMDEEFANFLKEVNKTVRKEVGKNLKDFIARQEKIQTDVKMDEAIEKAE